VRDLGVERDITQLGPAGDKFPAREYEAFTSENLSQ